MALKPGEFVRAISHKCEANFGDYKDTYTDYQVVSYEGMPIEREVENYDENSNERTGSHGADRAEILSWVHRGQDGGRAEARRVGLAMGCMATSESAALASGESAIYDKTFDVNSSSLALRTRNVVEKYGNKITQVSGMTISKMTISSERGGMVKIINELIGGYAFKASSITQGNLATQKAATLQNYLKAADLQFDIGTYNLSTDVFTSGVNHKSKLISFEASLEQVVDVQRHHGDQNLRVSALEATGRNLSLKAQIEIDDVDTFLSNLESQNQFAVKIPIIGAAIPGAVAATKYQATLIFPLCQMRSVKPADADNKLARDLEFQILNTYNDSVFRAIVTDKVASYIATT